MSASCRELSAHARTFRSRLLRRIEAETSETIAKAIGRDRSYISKITSGEVGVKIDDMFDFFAVLNLKVVDREHALIDVNKYNALLVIAGHAINTEQALVMSRPVTD